YIPPKLFEIWELKDPIKNYESYLLSQQLVLPWQLDEIKIEFKEKIESELAIGFDSPAIVADEEEELNDLYAVRSATATVVDNSATSHIAGTDLHDLRF